MRHLRVRRIPLLIAALALLMSSCASLQEQFEDLPRLTKKDLRFRLAESSRIMDASGNTITTLHETENRTVIALRKIPKTLQDAVVAIEDERFYEHEGVDFRAILRAFVTNARSGEVREGGSTITQQYVKNVIIAPGDIAEKTLRRKIVEAALSRQLEQRLGKKEILERYLNTVYFGKGAYGVQAAAFTYFGKPASELSLAQSAMIAGVIRSPETYDPYENPKAAKDRRNTVLEKMAELEWAPIRKVEKAKREKLHLEEEQATGEYAAPYFIDYVKRLITYDPRFAAVGDTITQRSNRLFQGGLRIYTTLDMEMQAAAEDAVTSVLPYPNDPSASMVAIDPESGYVKAMVGGRDWFAPRKEDPYAKLNLAIVAEPNLGCTDIEGTDECANRAPGTGRQAGSAFKPFALAAALDQGVSLSETYKASACRSFPGADAGRDWRVCNYESTDFGSEISLLEATVNSVNVVYAQLILDVGPEDGAELAADMGINTTLLATPSMVLGSNPVNPLGMASGYATFASNGVHHPPVAITRIVDTTTGDVIYQDKTEEERVLDPGVAYLTTTALQAVIERGTGVRAQIGRPAAGKTGTAQEYRDAWFGGYTPDLAAAVWVGYPEGEIEMKASCSGSTTSCRPTRIDGTGVTGGSYPAMIWQAFMARALIGIPASAFTKPDISLVTVVIDSRTGCLANRLTPDEYKVSATFAKGTEPEKACRTSLPGVKVPDVFSYPVEEATDLLERAGFAVTTVDQPDDTYPPGRVIGQDPGAGEKAPAGSTVTLYISARVEETTVPDVLGQTRSSAEAELRNAGFEVEVIVEDDGNKGKKGKNRVWKQSPAGGSQASQGSTVTIWVNPG